MPGKVWNQAIEVAFDQHGFVTFADIRHLGADPALLRQWHQRGGIERRGHGIYRFPQFPATVEDPLMLATLWPGGRGILSHETALDVHELCDVNPDKIHITVPQDYRPRRRGGEHYVVHRAELTDQQITWHEGIRIVTPATAIRQGIEAKVPKQLLRQAIEKLQARGAQRDTVIELTQKMEAK